MSRDRRLAVWASGGDIFDRADKCQFIHQPAPATLRLGAVLEDFRTPSAYAKAGCMLRASLAPDAAHASVLVWPDGRIMACWRSEAGGETIERCLSVAPLPAGFGLERTEGEIRAVYPAGDGQLRTWIFPHVAALADGGVGGWAVSAQRETAAAYAEFSSLVLTNGSWPGAGGDRQFPNLLDNGGFDEQAEKPTTARGWEHVGPAFPREADRETSLGEAHIRFDPRQRRDRQPAALAQAIASLTPGQRYVFSIAVRCAEQDACGDDELELRIEAPRGQRILHVATRKWRVRDLPPGQWNRIFVAGTAPSETARVVIRVEGDGGGDWLLDAAEFRVSTQYGPIRAPDAVGSVPE
jgi:hypothetical protein